MTITIDGREVRGTIADKRVTLTGIDEQTADWLLCWWVGTGQQAGHEPGYRLLGFKFDNIKKRGWLRCRPLSVEPEFAVLEMLGYGGEEMIQKHRHERLSTILARDTPRP